MTPFDVRVCPSCGGAYMSTQADGSEYFHVCPRVANPAHQPDMRAPNYDPREVIPGPAHVDERYDTSGEHNLDANPRPAPAPRLAPAPVVAVPVLEEPVS